MVAAVGVDGAIEEKLQPVHEFCPRLHPLDEGSDRLTVGVTPSAIIWRANAAGAAPARG